jgi:hypothetical protein
MGGDLRTHDAGPQDGDVFDDELAQGSLLKKTNGGPDRAGPPSGAG